MIDNCIEYIRDLTNLNWRQDGDIGIYKRFVYNDVYLDTIKYLHDIELEFKFSDKIISIDKEDIIRHSRESKLNSILSGY